MKVDKPLKDLPSPSLEHCVTHYSVPLPEPTHAVDHFEASIRDDLKNICIMCNSL